MLPNLLQACPTWVARRQRPVRPVRLACLALACLVPAGVESLTAAEFQYPLGIAVTPDGTAYVADRNLHGVWKITDGKAEIFYRGEKRFRTPLNAAYSAAIDKDGRLLVGDPATREIYRFDDDGRPQPLTDGAIGIPVSLAVAADGAIFAGDLELQRIWKVPAAGGTPEEFAQVTGPRGLAFDEEGWLWVVSNGGPDQVLRIAPDGAQTQTVVEGRPLEFPHNIVVADGTAWITDNYADAIWKVVPGQPPAKLVSGEPFRNPVGLARHDGRLLVVDSHARKVFTVSPEGQVTELAE